MESVFNLDTLKSLELSSFKDFKVNESIPNKKNERGGRGNESSDRQLLSFIGGTEEQFRADPTCISSIPTDWGKDDSDSERTVIDDESDSVRNIIGDDSDYERTIIDDGGDSQRSITDEEYRVDENKYRLMLIEHLSKRQQMAASSASNARRRMETHPVSHDRVSYELLEMGSGIVFEIPPNYDALAQSLNLPTLSDVKIDASVDLTNSNLRVAAERWARNQNAGYSTTYPSLQDRLNQSLRAPNSIPFNLKVVGDSEDVEATAMQAFKSDHVDATEKQIVTVAENPSVFETSAMPATQYVLVPESSSVLERFATLAVQYVPLRRLPSAIERSTMPATQQHSSGSGSGMQAFEVPRMQHLRLTQNPLVLKRRAMPTTQQFRSGMGAFDSDHVEAPLMQHVPIRINPPVLGRLAVPSTQQLCSGMQVIDSLGGTEHQLTKEQQDTSEEGLPVENPDKIFMSDFHWKKIALKDISKHHKNYMPFHQKTKSTAKKLAEYCQKEVKYRFTRSLKLKKLAAKRTKKLARDMLVFYKRLDKEEAENRKKQEKEAAETLKRQEAEREEKRQQRGLNFLLAQSKMYAHFMQTNQGDGASTSEANLREGEDRDVDDGIKEEALKAAMDAAKRQKEITNQFDEECGRLGETEGSCSNIDMGNPSSMPCSSTVKAPNMLHATLTDYQLKGLQWLVNCYEMSVNGILADDMGLGKTVQAISFLAHLAEEKNKWGPFLVVAPASVVPNWADEMDKFCPDLIILPYWASQRTILTKRLNPRGLYRKGSNFHVLITNYEILVKDEKYLKRVKWQCMILDEAQAIKCSNSQRWKTLMSFECRNRVLLTGTPIQNNMAELWALLHFIMPTLFNSKEQFKEWFSKDIESHAERGSLLNEHNLKKLHDVLKPFILRRLKKDVLGEMMPSKTEVTINCKLSSRQRAFYQAIREKVSLADLIDRNCVEVSNLMNIVMQLRKVCNHPELFERIEARSTMYFGKTQNSLSPPRSGILDDIYYAGNHNPISYTIPKLVYRECTENLPISSSGSPQCFQQKWLNNLMNVFSTDNIHRSVFPMQENDMESVVRSGTFGFSRMVDLSPTEVAFLAKSSQVEKWLFNLTVDQYPDEIEEGKVRAVTKMLMMPPRPADSSFLRTSIHGLSKALIVPLAYRFLRKARKYRPFYSFVPAVSAPPVDVVCSDRRFAYQRIQVLHHPWMKRLFVGFARTSEFNGPAKPKEPHYLIQEIDSELAAKHPLLDLTHRTFGTSPPLQSFDFSKMLTDSGKMHTLDALLKKLRAENHRVLLFVQMTKMLDILEDYMNYRKYKYLRLDGSSSVADRHGMVKEFQRKTDIFVFLLSTRAGGVGINLTAADIVIFYESDWNPTQDKQAMDRAHRLGQTKEVTVYRLICKGTIEEKILQRAEKKNAVQQLVMTGRRAKGDEMAADDVLSLFVDYDYDDSQLEQKIKEMSKDKLEKRTWKFDIEDGNVHIKEMEGDKSGEVENVKTQRKKRKARFSV